MSTKRSGLARKLTALIVAVVCFFIVGFLTLTRGHVRGVEFAPSHFQLRSFEFYQIPLIKLQVSPIWRSSLSSNICLYLASNNLITVPSGPPTKWDLVEVNYGSINQLNADASLMIDGLDQTPTTTNSIFNQRSQNLGPEWEFWSEENPEASKVLWPAVQQLCERELYVLVPELFRIARRHEEGDFAAIVAEYVSREQASMAQDFLEAEQPFQAQAIIEEGLQQTPNDPRLKALLDRLAKQP